MAMAKRWRAALPPLALLALVVLTVGPAAAQPSESENAQPAFKPRDPPSPSPGTPYPNNTNYVIDVYEQTSTATLFVKWAGKRPDAAKTAFTAADVPLKFSADYFDNTWATYSGNDANSANTIMQQIRAAMKCRTDEACKRNAFPSKVLNTWVKENIATVRGEELLKAFDRPQECNGALPNPCPADGGRYGPNLINVPAVWEKISGVPSVNPTKSVMVIDTGILTTHVEFKDNENLIPGLSIDLSTSTPAPITEIVSSGHGTHVAGTVFGLWNGQGMAGIVGKARGAVCKAFVPDANGPGVPGAPVEAQIRCIEHAIKNKFDIINLSIGGARRSQLPSSDPVRIAMERFCQSGGIFAIAAGNDNIDIGAPNFVYPANFANDLAAKFPNCIITVAAVDAQSTLSSFGVSNGRQIGSNFGRGVSVAAPGSNILSAFSSSNTATSQISGTSMASPHVAGVMTLLWNAFPKVKGTQVVSCLKTTATKRVSNNPVVIGQGKIDGGLIDAAAAYDCLEALAPKPSPSPSPPRPSPATPSPPTPSPPTPTPPTNPGRFLCITESSRSSQVCLTAAQVATVLPGARASSCTVARVFARAAGSRNLLQETTDVIADDAAVAAAATGGVDPDTFKHSYPPRCGVFGDSVCISWKSSISLARNPFVTISVTAVDAAGVSQSADISVTARRSRGFGEGPPGCVAV